MNYLRVLKAVFLLTMITNLSFGAEMDSVRLEKREGKQFVIHRVGQGETLYAISRRYQSSVEEISKTNNLSGNSVAIGQEIAIPWKRDVPKSMNQNSASGQLYHTVEAGQTLYAISRQYDVSVDEIKRLNNLTSNELSTGQQLVVKKGQKPLEQTAPVKPEPVATKNPQLTYHTVAPSETLFSISQKYDVSVDDIKKWNDLKSNSLSVGQELAIGKPATIKAPVVVAEETPAREKKKELVVSEASNGSLKQINKQGYTRDTASVAGYEKVVEEGFAMVIENSPETRKFLALHRTAPIGAILEVKNRMNGRSIYVRVVGKLPDTGTNNKVLIRLSEKAFQRLESVDPKVPVEVSYVP
jgi:LysM repeat protein